MGLMPSSSKLSEGLADVLDASLLSCEYGVRGGIRGYSVVGALLGGVTRAEALNCDTAGGAEPGWGVVGDETSYAGGLVIWVIMESVTRARWECKDARLSPG